jgi:hypothetical protein
MTMMMTTALAVVWTGVALAAPQAAPPATDVTVEQSASPELVGELVKELAITPAQAQGAAGTMFGVAKTKLSADDFAKVAAAVPNMDGLLKLAPAAKGGTSALAALGGAAAAAGSLSKLGLKPETILKVAPSLVKFVQSKGGQAVASLLANALK